ncbi:hypothetical protein ABH968_001106 [Lysinibacillus sp. RC79]
MELAWEAASILAKECEYEDILPLVALPYSN